MNPAFWALNTLWILTHAGVIRSLFPPAIYYVSVLGLYLGNFSFVYVNVAGTLRTEILRACEVALVSAVLGSHVSGYVEGRTATLYSGRTSGRRRSTASTPATEWAACVARPPPRGGDRTHGVGHPRARTRSRRVRRRWPAARKWRLAAFLCLYAAYGSLGYRLVVVQHVIVGDAVARLAHAFFVFYGAPAKVVSIGFVWPPIMTAVFLPFAAIKPLATSLAALPLTSAFFGALLVISIEKALARLGCGLALRLALVALFALNPMTIFYATNGMAEIVYLTFLVLAIDSFMAWCIGHVEPGLFQSVLHLGVIDRATKSCSGSCCWRCASR